MADAFPAEELAALSARGIVLWGGRVIFAAQPPMSEADILDVQSRCAGPLPEALLDLWRFTAGGRLGYDLSVPMLGRQEQIDWVELFYNGSDSYRDLRGWMNHELDLAQEAAEEDGVPFEGRLEWLPIGGFEYLSRVYICTSPGERHGSVIAWKHGLPPAWEYRLHEDAIGDVATSLEEAFARLVLNDDPLAPLDDYHAGADLLQYVEAQVEDNGLPRDLAHRLLAHYREVYVDWRDALAAGRLMPGSALAETALRDAISTDNSESLMRLCGIGIGIGSGERGVRGVVLAVNKAAWCALEVLLDAGARVPADILAQVDSMIPVEVTSRLLSLGAQPLPAAVLACIKQDAAASVELMLARLRQHPAVGLSETSVTLEAKAELGRLRKDLKDVRAGKLSHHLGEDGLQLHITRLDGFIQGPLPSRV